VVTIVSPRYLGDIGALVGAHLSQVGIRWEPIDDWTQLAHFAAVVEADGAFRSFAFVDNGALDPLTAKTLAMFPATLDRCSAVVTCTDISIAGLTALRARTDAAGIPFWVIATDEETAPEIARLRPLPDGVCLNIDELAAVSGIAPTDVNEVTRTARRLVGPSGVVLTTLGEGGAVLVDAAAGRSFHQSPGERMERSALGAGDVTAAALLAHRLAGSDWAEALSRAVATAEQFIRMGDPPAPTFDRVEARPPIEHGSQTLE
jgi:sugar/nucleoside kinase (ribokinase family)